MTSSLTFTLTFTHAVSLSVSLAPHFIGILAPLQFLSKVFLQKITAFPLGIKVLHTCVGEIEAGGPWNVGQFTDRGPTFSTFWGGGADARGLERTAGKAD